MRKLARYREQLYTAPELRFLFFELTDACNLACRHCGSSCSPQNGGYLPAALVYKTLREVAAKYGTSRTMVCLTGGEPLLHPDFFAIAEYIDALGFKWGITTNATLITPQSAQKLKKSHITSVSFSLDGTRESHNFLRGGEKAYDTCVRGIKNFNEALCGSAVTMITTVIHRKNIGQLEEIFNEVCALNPHIWRVVNVDPIGKARSGDLLLDGGQYRELFGFIYRKRHDPAVKFEVTYGCSHYLGAEFERELRDNYFICGAGVYVASVLCNGDIYACLDIGRQPELVQGNVARDNFTEVWENKFGVFRTDRSALCAECARCEHRAYCAGDSAHTWDFQNNAPLLCFKNILYKG